MKQYIIMILISFHLLSSSAYATKVFIDNDHLHNNNKCTIHEHQHHHFLNASNHQHKHSHAQVNISYVDFFTDSSDISLYFISTPKQAYLETISWISNPTLESLFRPPKI